MKRSSEFMRAKGMETPKEELSHLRVHPTEDGVKVEHFMKGKHGAQATHEFTEKEPFMEHMDKHMGPHLDYAGKGGEPEAHSDKAVGGLEEE